MDCGASAYCDGARRRRRDGRGARGAYGGVGARRAGAGAAAAGAGARGLGPGQCCGWGGAGSAATSVTAFCRAAAPRFVKRALNGRRKTRSGSALRSLPS